MNNQAVIRENKNAKFYFSSQFAKILSREHFRAYGTGGTEKSHRRYLQKKTGPPLVARVANTFKTAANAPCIFLLLHVTILVTINYCQLLLHLNVRSERTIE